MNSSVLAKIEHPVWRSKAAPRIAPLFCFAALIPLAVAVVVAALYPINPDFYFFAVREYMPIESLQVVLYLLGSVFALLVARRLNREGQRTLAVIYLLGALGLFFVAGEEISWGQEIFERIIPWWPQQEEFRQVNQQGEMTLHNLHGVGRIFSLGLFALALYGFVSPLGRQFATRRGETSTWVRYLTFSPVAMPSFAIATAFFVALFFIYDGPRQPPYGQANQAFLRYQEVAEFAIAFAVCFFVWQLWRGSARAASGDISPELGTSRVR